jgi:hypothetical protein
MPLEAIRLVASESVVLQDYAKSDTRRDSAVAGDVRFRHGPILVEPYID